MFRVFLLCRVLQWDNLGSDMYPLLDRRGTQGLNGIMSSQKHIQQAVELLAPAGSLESFFAALESGADAVFCGLKSFSARAKAKNFTLDELACLSGYAHARNKKVYVALNTLMKESELPSLVETLEELGHLSVDGLIIQDFGLYNLAHSHFPEIPLHASTQMVVHNLAGVRMLEKLGFERAVLARELSLDEIAYIAKNSSLELEHFIHGALCYSISGHCLFSSYLDGRSGNRGRCIQPCRRRYHYKGESGFYFSTSDFSALDHIPALCRAGVMSLKIEGRMKSAEYVAAVVLAYRTVMDATPGKEKEALARAKETLEGAMGRTSSPGFLPGLGGADIVLPKRKGGIGRIIGKIERLQGKAVSFRTGDVLHVGDRLRIQPGNDRAGQGFTVRKLIIGKRAVKRAAKGTVVSIPFPFQGKAQRGDLVFKLATGKAFTMSVEACRRRLNAAPLPAQEVRLNIDCKEAESSITVHGLAGGVALDKTYTAEMILARKSPLSEKTLLKVFSHTGHPALTLAGLQAEKLPPVVIKPSRLKEIRRDFYGVLDKLLGEKQLQLATQRLHRVREAIAPPGNVGKTTRASQVYIVSDQLEDLQGVADHHELQFIFPLNRVFLEEVRHQGWEKTARDRIIWDLPSILFDQDWSAMAEMVEELLRKGFSRFRLNNIAHFAFFTASADVKLMAGPWLYTLNSQAVAAMNLLGCRKFSLSLEDDKENMQSLLDSGNREALLLTVFASIDLFTSRIPVPIKEQQCTVQNDKGDLLHIVESEGLTVTRAGKRFSLLGKLKELRKMPCCDLVLDMRGIGFGTSAGQEVMGAFYDDTVLPDTVELNFKRGLA